MTHVTTPEVGTAFTYNRPESHYHGEVFTFYKKVLRGWQMLLLSQDRYITITMLDSLEPIEVKVTTPEVGTEYSYDNPKSHLHRWNLIFQKADMKGWHMGDGQGHTFIVTDLSTLTAAESAPANRPKEAPAVGTTLKFTQTGNVGTFEKAIDNMWLIRFDSGGSLTTPPEEWEVVKVKPSIDTQKVGDTYRYAGNGLVYKFVSLHVNSHGSPFPPSLTAKWEMEESPRLHHDELNRVIDAPSQFTRVTSDNKYAVGDTLYSVDTWQKVTLTGWQKGEEVLRVEPSCMRHQHCSRFLTVEEYDAIVKPKAGVHYNHKKDSRQFVLPQSVTKYSPVMDMCIGKAGVGQTYGTRRIKLENLIPVNNPFDAGKFSADDLKKSCEMLSEAMRPGGRLEGVDMASSRGDISVTFTLEPARLYDISNKAFKEKQEEMKDLISSIRQLSTHKNTLQQRIRSYETELKAEMAKYPNYNTIIRILKGQVPEWSINTDTLVLECNEEPKSILFHMKTGVIGYFKKSNYILCYSEAEAKIWFKEHVKGQIWEGISKKGAAKYASAFNQFGMPIPKGLDRKW